MQNKQLSKLEQIKQNIAQQSNANLNQSNLLHTSNMMPIADIKRNPYQPRKVFDEVKLQELTESIKENGLMQAIVLAEVDGVIYLVAGERRLEAHIKAELEEIKYDLNENIKTMEDLEDYALYENLHRDDLKPMEYAIIYKRIKDRGLSLRDLEKKINKSKTTIDRFLNLTKFSEECQNYILDNNIDKLLVLLEILKAKEEHHLLLLKKVKEENYAVKDITSHINRLETSNAPKIKEEIEKNYPYDLTEIQGVNISNTKNNLTIKINTKDFDLNDSKNIERYIKKIIEKMKE